MAANSILNNVTWKEAADQCKHIGGLYEVDMKSKKFIHDIAILKRNMGMKFRGPSMWVRNNLTTGK